MVIGLFFGDDDFDKRTAKEAERIFKDTEYFTAFMEVGAFFSHSLDYLCNMLTDPEIIIEENQKNLDSSLKYVGK